MRRGIKFSKKAYIFLALTAIFNLSSIVFDQLVVQQEDKIRKFDHIINEQKQEVYANLNSHKIFNELFFKVHFNAADLITDLNYLVRATNFFNGDLPKKIEENKIKKIKKIYVQKTKNIITKFEKSVTDSQLIFSKVKNDKAFIKFTKKERPVEDWYNPLFPLLRLEKDFRKLKNKIQYDYFSYQGRRLGAHSGSSSDDLIFFLGYSDEISTALMSFNKERHGIKSMTHPELKTEYSLIYHHKMSQHHTAFITLEYEKIKNFGFMKNNISISKLIWFGYSFSIN